jgi:hypothetical protein
MSEWRPLAEALALAPSEEALCVAGVRGDIRARVIALNGTVRGDLLPEAWGGEVDWERSRIRPPMYAEITSGATAVRRDLPWTAMKIYGWHRVEVDLDSVRTHFGSNLPAPKRGGGRSPTWKWEEFWCELAAIVHDEGLPETDADLIRRMEEWFVREYDDQPDSSGIAKRIRKLRRKIGWN